jgi:hypothetical protein
MEHTYEKIYKVSTTIDKLTGNVVEEFWRDSDGQLGRFGGPAHTVYDRVTGVKLRETHYAADTISLNSDTQPAVREWDINGNLRLEAYYFDDVKHRNGGKPAVIYYDPAGEVVKREYYHFGRPYTPQKRSPKHEL